MKPLPVFLVSVSRACRMMTRRLMKGSYLLPPLCVMVTATAIGSTDWNDGAYVACFIDEVRSTAVDYRVCRTEVTLESSGRARFRYTEDVLGSAEKEVKASDFLNEAVATPEMIEALESTLVSAGIVSEVSEEKPSLCVYAGEIRYRLGAAEGVVHYWTPPLSSRREAINRALLDFAASLGIDRPTAAGAGVVTSEGDLQECAIVSFDELLSDPTRYDGRRVSLIGYIQNGPEDRYIVPDLAKAAILGNRILCGAASLLANREAVAVRQEGLVRVEGVFLVSRMGYSRSYPGQLVRVTLIEPVTKS